MVKALTDKPLVDQYRSDVYMSNVPLVGGSCGTVFVVDRRTGNPILWMKDLTSITLNFNDRIVQVDSSVLYSPLFEYGLKAQRVDIEVYQPVYINNARKRDEVVFEEFPSGYLNYRLKNAKIIINDLTSVVGSRMLPKYLFVGEDASCYFVENNSVTIEKLNALKDGVPHWPRR